MRCPFHPATFGLAALISATLIAACPAWSAERERSDAAGLDLERVQRKWTGDLDGMTERHMIRALVVYSKTFYFLDGAEQRGATYDALHAFEQELNRKLGKKVRRVQVVFVPVSRDELLPALREGRGSPIPDCQGEVRRGDGNDQRRSVGQMRQR